jgi:diguanylate cyclase (GGDEF)-like protein
MLLQNGRLCAAAAPTLPESYIRVVNGMPIGPSVASCGTAAFEGNVISVSDITTSPLWENYRDLALRHHLRSCWSAPVYSSSGLIVGTIAVYNREPRHPEKAQIELLQMACRFAAVSIEQREITGRLAFQARHDTLTGLPNRLSFEERMKHALAGARRHKRSVGLLAVDLDRFKLVNDTLGHGVGDGLLKEVARRIERCVRETDIVARWGGDEFMVGLTELSHKEDAALVAQKVLDVLKQPVPVQGHEPFVTATIGVSVYPEDGQDLAALVRNADRAMFRAKNQGRNNFEFYTPQDGDAAGQRLELECQLRGAIERGELTLHYQPQYELADFKLAGLEALLRWNHPALGSVPPATFIPIAEETGLIVPIGAWVLQEVCRQLAEWQRAGCRPLRVAVNVSTIQFDRPDFFDAVAGALKRMGISPSLLELEMTESLVMRNLSESALRMAKLRDLGISIAIDDFGTGYSSLSCLKRLPIDTLKIDQSFVRDLQAESGTLPVVQAIVSLACNFGMRTTAEGIETQSQLDALWAIGCDLGQGYFFAPALTVDKVSRLMNSGPGRNTFIVAMPPPKEDTRSRECQQHFAVTNPRLVIRRSARNLAVI